MAKTSERFVWLMEAAKILDSLVNPEKDVFSGLISVFMMEARATLVDKNDEPIEKAEKIIDFCLRYGVNQGYINVVNMMDELTEEFFGGKEWQ